MDLSIRERIRAALYRFISRFRKRPKPSDPPPADPFAYVTAPRKPRTPLRGSAVAVMEPPDD